MTALVAWAAMAVDRAWAGAEVCTPCVMVVEVDGLEAKDVTPHTTPFLWALGHSGPGGGNSAGDTGADPVALGAAATPGFSQRNGWSWAAARGVMTSTTAAAATALLTGSYAEQSNVFSDDFFTNGAHMLLGSRGDDGTESIDPESAPLTTTVGDENDRAFAWLGDGRLANIVGLDNTWVPTMQDSVPAYCPAPQTTEEFERYGADIQNGEVSCPTADLNVIRVAGDDLANAAKTGGMTFGYVHLAELGAIKRLHGDVDATVDAAAAAGGEQDAQAVAEQLAQTDAAIGLLVNRYARDAPDKWNNTVLFVVGNHGYELTPVSHRVPYSEPGANPESRNPGMGLADVVKRIGQQHNTTATFIPQGTMGTVYVNPGPNHDAAVKAIAHALVPGGEVDDHELCHPETALPAGAVEGGCIEEVLATGATDAAGHSTIPPAGEYEIKSVQDAHPSWRLHYVDARSGKASGSDGDLLVVAKPGWATGVILPVKDDNGVPNPLVEGGDADNPYLGSAGGPRNRSIAAIVNGRPDIVRQFEVGVVEPGADALDLAYPVAAQELDEENCPTTLAGLTRAPGNPNLDPGDDAHLPGHECQAETVDLAPTIAALLRVALADTQLGGRFLQEAFARRLSAVREEEQLVEPALDDPPPPPLPDVRIPEIPPPPPGYTYSGLMRGLRATVVDVNGCTWATARPGATLDHLKIEADLGKALSATTLTFYKRSAPEPPAAAPEGGARSRGPRSIAASVPRAAAAKKCLAPKAKSAAKRKGSPRPPLEAIARFNPFALKRGHVVLKLKIPELYRPTHIGLFVQEAQRLDAPKVQPDGSPGLAFEAFGPAAGAIVAVAQGNRLHKTKPKPRAAKANKRKARRPR